MSHHIWHAFYYDRPGEAAPPCRSEVFEAVSAAAAARVARAHMGECRRVSLESAPWMHRANRVIFAEAGERRRAYLH